MNVKNEQHATSRWARLMTGSMSAFGRRSSSSRFGETRVEPSTTRRTRSCHSPICDRAASASREHAIGICTVRSLRPTRALERGRPGRRVTDACDRQSPQRGGMRTRLVDSGADTDYDRRQWTVFVGTRSSGRISLPSLLRLSWRPYSYRSEDCSPVPLPPFSSSR